MKLAIIPARGGSKRIPRKNIKPFCGQPMIAWTIDAARQSECFDRIIVSTDDAEIADVAREYGAEVPFARPAHLADDYATTGDVIRHAINWMEEHESRPVLVCCLYATAPFLHPADLKRGLAALDDSQVSFAFSVTAYPFPIQRAIRIGPMNRVEMFMPEYFNSRSQDLEEMYHDAGQFYWGATDAWLSGRPVYSSSAYAVVLPRYRVQDIDTPEDWIQAELMFKSIRNADAPSP